MKYRLVKVEWVDAATDNGWMTIAEAKKHSLAKPTTVGYLITDSDARIVVAQTMDADSANGVIAIPKSWIVTIKDLGQ